MGKTLKSLVAGIALTTSLGLGGCAAQYPRTEQLNQPNEVSEASKVEQQIYNFLNRIPTNMPACSETGVSQSNGLVFSKQEEYLVVSEDAPEKRTFFVCGTKEKGASFVTYDTRDSITNSQPFGYEINTDGKMIKIKTVNKAGKDSYTRGNIIYEGKISKDLGEMIENSLVNIKKL